MRDLVEDVAQVLRYEDLYDEILVGHSFSGSVVSALADSRRDCGTRLATSAVGPVSGEWSPSSSIERYRQRAIETDLGPVIPPLDP
jgi:pimeloyl-ACP methyl ester carboxylesterase